MPRDTGPRKRTPAEKAKQAVLAQSTKRVRAAQTTQTISTSGSSITSRFIQFFTLTLSDADDNGNDDDMLLSTASRASDGATSSRATSPVNSNANDTDVVYEIDSDDDDMAPEKPTESAEAELSMQSF